MKKFILKLLSKFKKKKNKLTNEKIKEKERIRKIMKVCSYPTWDFNIK